MQEVYTSKEHECIDREIKTLAEHPDVAAEQFQGKHRFAINSYNAQVARIRTV